MDWPTLTEPEKAAISAYVKKLPEEQLKTFVEGLRRGIVINQYGIEKGLARLIAISIRQGKKGAVE